MFNIAWRMMWHDKLKSAGTLFGVFFAVTLISQQLAVLFGLVSLMTAIPDSVKADLWIVAEKTETVDFGVAIPERKLYQALGTEGIAWAEPVYIGTGSMKRPDGSSEVVRIIGSDAPRFAAGPFKLREGSEVSALTGSDTVFVDWQDRSKLGDPELGETRELNGQQVRIAGFTQGMRPFGAVYVFSSLDNARRLSNDNGAQKLTYILVGIAPGTSVEQAKANLASRVTDIAIYTSAEISNMSRTYWLTRTSIGLNFGIQVAFAVVVGFVVVALTLFTSVVDRLREFGTMKALGARKKDLRRLLLAQATLFAVIGYSFGIAAFWGASTGMMKAGGVVYRPPALFIGVAIFTLFLCIVSALLAARRVLKLEPAIVFRG
jgi:putative ABC transport system permease protein